MNKSSPKPKQKPSEIIRDKMNWERKLLGRSLSYQANMEIKINAIIEYLDECHKQTNHDKQV